MFSFKPRVYRSTDGCCICRAKSSSSRFTDSRKYEEDSIKCFDLKHPRHGEICNACVLLVKRYKRLPPGSQRNWRHVVDARAGPGTKTIMKVKRHKEENSAKYQNQSQNQDRFAGKSIIPEKFSKIFKKSKKVKMQSPSKRQNQTPLIKKQTNSMDTDDNESRESSPEVNKATNNSTQHNVVLFQTQTRASAFRSRNKLKHMNIIKPSDSLSIRRPPILNNFIGSKRRKKVKPKKLDHHTHSDEVKFFDETEWTKHTTCCGIYYECAKLNGAIIIDVDQYKKCQHHIENQQLTTEKEQNADKDDQQAASLHALKPPKCVIKATLPAVVKLSLPFTTLTKPAATVISSNMKSTPVLKKHHLYFKRQSETFPQGETETVKTENCKNVSNIDTETHITHFNDDEIIETENLNSAQQTTVPSKSTANTKSTNFLHKIKSDAGKIVKHSIDKFNSAVRLKAAHDLSDIQHLVKAVDKNHLTTKATTSANATVGVKNATEKIHKTATEILPSITTSATANKFSDNSSDSGFDENVQDRKSVSPLQQENDTKNIPPPVRAPVQTLILASGVRVHGQTQNLVYAGNETAAKILQQRVQPKNAITLKSNTTVLQHNKHTNVQILDATQKTTFKLIPAKTGNQNGVISIGAAYNLGSGVKMLYNNNAIKHENGITTIVPASSMAATKQTNQISMEANAPNTITITPAPSTSSIISVQNRSMTTNPMGFQQQQSNDSSTLTHISNRRAI